MRSAKDNRKTRDYWSDCGLINFVDGIGWGLDETGKTWCLGNESDVLKAIETGELPDYLIPQKRRVLSHILELRKEILKNEPKEYTPGSAVGSRPARTFKRRQANLRQNPQRRKSALHKVR